jgi:hypothetical protein
LGITEFDADRDSDMMPNGYEFNNGLNPTVDDADSDADYDGFNNYQEFLDGTDPLDPFSRAEFFTFYVSTTGGDTYPYQNWGDASVTIQAAIDASHSGDTVVVAESIYFENIFFNGKSIVLISTDHDSEMVVQNTIIDGSQSDNLDSGSVVTFNGIEAKPCMLSGFTIRNGRGTLDNGYYIGGGIYGNGSNATIQNNIIQGNSAIEGFGGGVFACNGLIQDNTIINNLAINGGGLVWCNGTIRNNIISNNSVTGSGGGVHGCNGLIQNNAIIGNKAKRGFGGGLAWCNGTIRNNTINDNFAGQLGGGLFLCNGTIVNCIIWGNFAPDAPQLLEGSHFPTYSCIQDWTDGGVGNISDVPFIAYDGYHLMISSPCIDSGYDSGSPPVDIEGEARPQEMGVDIGADEYKDSDWDGLPDWIEVLGITAFDDDSDSDMMPNEYEFNNGLNPTVDDADSDADYDGFNNYHEFLDGTDPLDPFSRAEFFTFYVSTTGGDTYPHQNWGDASVTIQAAIDASRIGDTVIVAEGIYFENIFFNGKSIVLVSTDPESQTVVANTVIDGSDSGSVITFGGPEKARCVLNGFSIRNGTGTVDVIYGYHYYGGGIYGNGNNATIRNNIIVGNSANHGGGLYQCYGLISNNIISGNSALRNGGGLNNCTGLIHRNIICGNYAGDGGGLYSSNAIILTNTIVGNLARNSGGLYSRSGAIYNNTIANNSAESHWGGGQNFDGVVMNCIIWGNIASEYPQLYDSTLTYSCIQDWSDHGEGNISSNPMFSGNPYDAGTWTYNSVFDSVTFSTTLTDTSNYWVPGSLAGKFLRPDDATVLQYLIASNSDTTITIWCDVSDSAHAGDIYKIYDYRLLPGSPCIDAGNMFIEAGDYDLDVNPRYVDASDTSGWDGNIKGLLLDDGDTTHIAWKLIDMGAYEYQPAGDLYETFTVQSRDALGTGTWQDLFTGNVGTWTDTSTAGADKRFYRVYAE